MKLNLEVELIPEWDEINDDVVLTALRFPGCNQNVLIFLSTAEQKEAQEALESAVQDAAIARVEMLLERRGPRLGQYRSPRTGE